MSKDEKSYEILDTVAKIFDFNKKHQQGRGLKILTPQQMLSRLPISSAQLKAGNNSQKQYSLTHNIPCIDQKS